MKRMSILKRSLMCLVLCIGLLSSLLTVSAAEVQDSDILSSLEKVSDTSEYVIISKNTYDEAEGKISTVLLNSNYKYATLYVDENGAYYLNKGVSNDHTVVKKEVKSVDDLSVEEDFVTYSKDFYYSPVDLPNDKTPITILVYDEKDIKVVGTYSLDNIKDIKVVDISYDNTPVIKLSTKGVEGNKAVIHVEYSFSEECLKYAPCQAKFKSMSLYSGDSCVENINQLEATVKDNVYDFEVTSNGEYEVRVESFQAIGTEKIKVDSISEVTSIDENEKSADTVAPKITFDSFPESETSGNEVKLKMYSDEPAILNFNGVASDSYVTEMEFSLSNNGSYTYSATDKSGNVSEDTLKVEFFKDLVLADLSDRDNFWSTAGSSSIMSKLPQTGGVSLICVLGAGLIGIVLGVFLIFKSKSNKMGHVAEDNIAVSKSDEDK